MINAKTHEPVCDQVIVHIVEKSEVLTDDWDLHLLEFLLKFAEILDDYFDAFTKKQSLEATFFSPYPFTRIDLFL